MIRIGNSIDIHRFCDDTNNRKLVLGGIEIDSQYGLVGHSDADVVLHAITESIIGALGLGDLGCFFPDNDAQYKNIDSKLLLLEIKHVMEEKSYKVNNIDLIILCENVMLNKYRLDMKKSIADILNISEDLVNVKATRGEKLGFIGRGEGIACMCTLLLTKEGLNE